MKRLVTLTLCIVWMVQSCVKAQTAGSVQTDSARAVALMREGGQLASPERFVFYAKALIGTPYVGHTLEKHAGQGERLEVNMRQMDCCTFIENVLALTLATDSATYEEFRHQLQRVRYRDGIVDGYASRNHYFAQWVESGKRIGIVEPVDKGDAVQTLNLNYMTSHREQYRGIRDDDAQYRLVGRYEREESGRRVRYFTREALRRSDTGEDGGTLRRAIKTGDILGIVTRKQGLDTTHLGIAVWCEDGKLHLLNASSLHKKVVLEEKTLYQYMTTQPSQLGVRVVRVAGVQ